MDERLRPWPDAYSRMGTSLATCGASCSLRPFVCPTDRHTQHWEEQRPSSERTARWRICRMYESLGPGRSCTSRHTLRSWETRHGRASSADSARTTGLIAFIIRRRVPLWNNPAKGTVVESRNVAFLKPPPYSHLPTKGLDYVNDDDEAYALPGRRYRLHLLPRPHHFRQQGGGCSSASEAPTCEDSRHDARKRGHEVG